MSRILSIALLIMLPLAGAAQDDVARTVDLRDDDALEQLYESNPDHYRRIHDALVRLQSSPELAEGDWLAVNIDARDVELSESLIKTSYPPKQLLQFTLDDVRYTMHLIRTDIGASTVPAM